MIHTPAIWEIGGSRPEPVHPQNALFSNIGPKAANQRTRNPRNSSKRMLVLHTQMGQRAVTYGYSMLDTDPGLQNEFKARNNIL
jgi:hypothetical protein